MSESLSVLEQQRADLQQEIAQLGDMRSGSITTTSGRCGNPNCHCHRPGEPAHGPYSRLTRKENGKTVTETFASTATLRKAQREVDAYHRFRELSRTLLAVNEQICCLRPVEEKAGTEQEKKRRPRSSRKSRKK